MSPLLGLVVRLWLTGAAPLAVAQVSPANAPDSVPILQTVHRFHAALAAGDSAAALALLTPDALILEAGDLETKTQYAAHHLAADIEFSRAVPAQPLTASVHQEGAAAWVVSTTTSRGTFRQRPVASQGAELIVLTRTSDKWLIRAIHWSSHRLER